MQSIAAVSSARRYCLAPDVLLTPDGPQRHWVLGVDNGEIFVATDRESFCRLHPNETITQLPGRAIVPGMVDAHTHLGHTFAKALTCGEPSQIWQRIWIPIEANLTPELNYVSAKWMFLEALRGGFTSVVNFAIAGPDKVEAIHRAARETGVRLVSTTGAVDRADYPILTGQEPKFHSIDDALERAQSHIAQCKGLQRITPSLCVSGPQAASPELVAATAGFCEREGVLFQVHSSEHHPEVHECIMLHGKRPIHYLADAGGLGPNSLVHHAVLVTEGEIEALRSASAAVSYNPVASQWKNDGIAPAMAFAARGIRMGLGTDSTRSDAFRLLDAAESCQRLASQRVMDYSCGAGWTWVDAATRGGADACGLGETAGQLRERFRADFLVLNMEVPEVMPSWDFEWELVRLYNRSQIEVVVVDGVPVVSMGKAVGWDQEQFLREHLADAVHTVRTSGLVRRHGSSGQVREATRKGRDSRIG